MRQGELIQKLKDLPKFENAIGDRIHDGSVFMKLGPDLIPIKDVHKDTRGNVILEVI